MPDETKPTGYTADEIEAKVDKFKAEGKWKFNGEVAQVFDNMLQRSIPQYDTMRKAIFDLACKFITPGDNIIDLGCSLGESLSSLIAMYGAHNRYIGVEMAPEMLRLVRQRFADWIETGYVKIEDIDLRTDFPKKYAGVILSILTLQFIPIEYRQRVVSHCHYWLKTGGALILVEKVLGETAELHEIYIERYLQMKKDNGYSQEEIDRKRIALEGVLVPVTAAWNEQMLKAAGFKYMDCFWRWMNFAGWIAIK